MLFWIVVGILSYLVLGVVFMFYAFINDAKGPWFPQWDSSFTDLGDILGVIVYWLPAAISILCRKAYQKADRERLRRKAKRIRESQIGVTSNFPSWL